MSSAWTEIFRRHVSLFVFVAIFLSVLPIIAAHDIADVDSFFSTMWAFDYAAKHHFQFGVDLIDNVGPYGYLHYPYAYSGTYWPKILWYGLIALIFSYYATQLTVLIKGGLERGLFVLALLLFSMNAAFPLFAYEYVPRLAIFFSAAALLLRRKNSGKAFHAAELVILGCFYAFLGLEKSSNTYFALFVIATLSLYWLLRRRWLSTVCLAGSFVLVFLAFWLIAGQSISNLPRFFDSLGDFIASYEAVMAEEMPAKEFWLGLFYCFVGLVLAGIRFGLLLTRVRLKFVFAPETYHLLLAGAVGFLGWKLGSLRGQGSYDIFAYMMAILIVYLALMPVGTNLESPAQRLSAKPLWMRVPQLAGGTLFILLAAMDVTANIPGGGGNIAGDVWQRLTFLATYHPVKDFEALDAKFAAMKAEHAIPQSLRAMIGQASVDEFGASPGIVVINDLNYRPRPVEVDFVAANEALKQRNASHYQNKNSAPDFIFVEDFGSKLSDSLAHLTMMVNYHAVVTFQRWTVMAKNQVWRSVVLVPLQDAPEKMNDGVSLEGGNDMLLWAAMEPGPVSIAGWMRKALFHWDSFDFKVLTDDKREQAKIASFLQLQSGILLNPDIAAAESARGADLWRRVQGFSLQNHSENQAGYIPQDYHLRMFAVAVAASGEQGEIVTLESAKALMKLRP